MLFILIVIDRSDSDSFVAAQLSQVLDVIVSRQQNGILHDAMEVCILFHTVYTFWTMWRHVSRQSYLAVLESSSLLARPPGVLAYSRHQRSLSQRRC